MTFSSSSIPAERYMGISNFSKKSRTVAIEAARCRIEHRRIEK
jgi:hypothetical protein